MRTLQDSIRPSSVYGWGEERAHSQGKHHDDDDDNMDSKALKKHKRLLKKIDNQLTSITRILILLVVLETIRMWQA
jgi:hypothetical protein